MCQKTPKISSPGNSVFPGGLFNAVNLCASHTASVRLLLSGRIQYPLLLPVYHETFVTTAVSNLRLLETVKLKNCLDFSVNSQKQAFW